MRQALIAIVLLFPGTVFASPYYDQTVTDTGFGGSITLGCASPNLVVVNITSTTDDVSAVTLGGVGMTKVGGSAHMINRYSMMYYLTDVASGSQTLVVTGGTALGVTDNTIMRSFCGLGEVDVSYVASDAVSTNYTHALTSTVDAWYVMLGTNSAIVPSDSTNCFLRSTSDAWLCDSNALLSAGSNSQTIGGGSATWGIVQAAFVEVSTSTEPSVNATSTLQDAVNVISASVFVFFGLLIFIGSVILVVWNIRHYFR